MVFTHIIALSNLHILLPTFLKILTKHSAISETNDPTNQKKNACVEFYKSYIPQLY